MLVLVRLVPAVAVKSSKAGLPRQLGGAGVERALG
jgi:hypothetical protein